MERRSLKILAVVGVTLFCSLAVAQTPNGRPSAENSFSVRPSEYSGGGQQGGYDYPTFAYDGSFKTCSGINLQYGNLGTKDSWETWGGFPSAPSGATGMQLNVNSSASVGEGGFAYLKYSLDGGSSSQYMYIVGAYGLLSQQTNYISLSNTQDLTKIEVFAEVVVSSDGHFASSASQSICEIWISGTD